MKFDNGIEDKEKAIALLVGRSVALLVILLFSYFLLLAFRTCSDVQDSGLMSNVILPLHFIVPTQ